MRFCRYTTAIACVGILSGAGFGCLIWSSGDIVVDFADQAVRPSDEPAFARQPANIILPAESEWLANALEQVDALGHTGESIERVATSLPDHRGQALRLIAISELTERDVSAAIAYALSLTPRTVQTAALQRVAGVAAISDPRLALDHASSIPEESRRTAFAERVFETWASLDPIAVFDYLERTGGASLVISVEAFATLASAEPGRLAAIMGGRLRSGNRTDFERAVIDALIATEPESAYALVGALPFGADRDRLLTTMVTSHSQLNAKEALSHIVGVRAAPYRAVESALHAAAIEDFPYALDLAVETLLTGESQSFNDTRLGLLFAATSGIDSAEVSAAVDLIANHPDQRVRKQLIGLAPQLGVLGSWAERDPDGAAAWIVRNSSHVSPGVVELIGELSAAASGDRVGALRTLDALPEELHGYWMAGVAEGLAASGLDAALEWLEPVRGAPIYAMVVDRVLGSAASTEPAAAARAIDNMAEPSAGLVLNVATAWGSLKPDEAGDWLAASPNIDDELRAMAVRQIVLTWAQRNLREAMEWTRIQPTGVLRDSALGAVVQVAAGSGTLDERSLEAFSSDSARVHALIGAMDALRRSDPGLGQSLIDRYISDPEQRNTAEQRLEGRAPRAPIRVVDGVSIR